MERTPKSKSQRIMGKQAKVINRETRRLPLRCRRSQSLPAAQQVLALKTSGISFPSVAEGLFLEEMHKYPQTSRFKVLLKRHQNLCILLRILRFFRDCSSMRTTSRGSAQVRRIFHVKGLLATPTPLSTSMARL